MFIGELEKHYSIQLEGGRIARSPGRKVEMARDEHRPAQIYAIERGYEIERLEGY